MNVGMWDFEMSYVQKIAFTESCDLKKLRQPCMTLMLDMRFYALIVKEKNAQQPNILVSLGIQWF